MSKVSSPDFCLFPKLWTFYARSCDTREKRNTVVSLLLLGLWAQGRDNGGPECDHMAADVGGRREGDLVPKDRAWT